MGSLFIKDIFIKSKKDIPTILDQIADNSFYKVKSNKKVSDSVFIPQGAIHRIENPHKVPVKILEIQTGSILKETDIVRYQDIYGRVK